MKVLVAGGGGFLGTEVVNSLIESGFEVKSLGRNFSSTIDCEQIIGDITALDSYIKLLSNWKPEVVIQAAWVTNQKTYRTSSLNSGYMTATLSFAEQSYLSGTQHFLALGSSAEYGSPKEPCNSFTTIAAPEDNYGISKLQTLGKLSKIAEKYSRKFSWARIFQPYGPNQDSTRLLPLATRELLAGNRFQVANPNVILDWISSRDVASALTYAIKYPINQIFDVGTSKPMSVLQVLKTLAMLLDVNPEMLQVKNKPRREDEKFLIVVSKESPLFKAKWAPQDDLVSGLKWTLSR
jgi:nucleoside-diphosphate-sugar epimerase